MFPKGKNKVILLLIFLLKIIAIYSINEIKINETIQGEMKQDESFEYYTLTIPDNTEGGKFILVFVVKEDKKSALDGEEVFSDPDIYVSKKEKKPHSPETSEYYSERYGNDILSIPSNEVNPKDIFYIGMYCQFSCKYKLKAYLSEEIEMDIGKMYTIELNRKSSLNYVIKVPDKDYNELNVIATSIGLEEFKIFMSKTTPSSQNTFKVIPSWASGYMISVEKNTRDYCKNCSYHILLQSGKEDCTIQLFAYFQNSITNVLAGSPVQDALKGYGKRCYSFNVFDISNLKNPKVVISTSLFSGNGILVIEGFKHDDNLDYDKGKKYSYSYEIFGEKSILLNEKDFKTFPSGNNPDEQKLYYCFLTTVSTSYTMSTYFLNQAQSLQDYNFIFPKTEVIGFLGDGQYTKYQVADFSSVSKNEKANITINFQGIVGFPKAYAYFCMSEDECFFDKEYFSQKQRNNNLIPAVYTSFQDSVIEIEGTENKCYFNEDCDLVVVISCSSSNTEYCQFKISANVEENALLMAPRISYYSIISVGKEDNYGINIIDEDIESIVIVLNTASGDAELTVFELKENEYGEIEEKKVGMSVNNDYIPDVVRLTPKKLGRENLLGSYLVRITATTFSSYNLYYYTTYKIDEDEKEEEEHEPDDSDVTLSLSEGVMLTDYFPNDIDYKIYTYQPNLEEKEDLKFVITPINVKFSFKVFLDLDNFEYDDEPKDPLDDRIKGYEWSSDLNGELIIKADDESYDLDNTYYIIVYMNNPEDNLLVEKSIMKYYIGVTTPSIPFILYEGVEQLSTLSNDYPVQTFWFLHTNLNQSFEVDINALYGEVDVYVNVEEITDKEVEKLETGNSYNEEYEEEDYKESSMVYLRKIKDYDSIILNTDYLNEYCSGDVEDDDEFYGCRVYIYVKRSKKTIKHDKSSQFLIVAKSSEKIGEYLTAGTSKMDYLSIGEYNYYIIEEIRKRKGSVISVSFTNGIGELYLRIPETPEYGDDIIFPNESNYTLKGTPTYNGKVIVVPEEYFQKINNENLKIQMFVAVKGESHGFNYDEEEESETEPIIEYTITYTADKQRLHQNIPYENYISSGEYKYFDLFFDKMTKNIYISLSNMNGDADLYLNYGDKEPTTEKYNWKSTTVGHEYIDFNIEHNFFKKNNIKSLEGHYTLLIVGYTDTSYTLFISSHDEKVIPLTDNSPMSCQCNNINEKCYFRYDDVYSDKSVNLEKEKSQVVFTTNYFYGNGYIYAKISKDSEINDVPKGKKVYDIFPNETNSDESTFTSNQRNFLRVKVKQEKYTKDSVILLTYVCSEPTLVEINCAKLSYEPVTDYLDVNRENIYYLKFNKDLSQKRQPFSLLAFFNSDDNNLIYNIHSYIGQGRIEIYTNETYYDEKQKKLTYDYNSIADLVLGNEDLNNTEQDQFSNFIQSTKSVQEKTIYFRIQPMTDFGFYIQLLYDNSWKSIPIGKTKEFFIKNDKLMGYFDIYDEYDGVEFTLSLDNVHNKRATVYIKINELVKNEEVEEEEETSPETAYKYIIPTQTNFDYKASTDRVLGLLSIELDGLPKIAEQENKFIRALFLVEIKDDVRRFRFDDDSYTRESVVNILINPSQNYIKRVDAQQLDVFYSNQSVVYDRKGKLQSVSEKIYALERNDEEDDVMVIEISSCRGDFEFKLSSNYNMSTEDIEYDESEENGRMMIIIENLKHKHIYFSVKAAQINEECEDEGSSCKTRLSYLMYYYSTTMSNFEISSVNETLQFESIRKGKIKIRIPKIASRDIMGDYRDLSEYKFDIFITDNEERYSSMGSVCYLSRYLDEVDPMRFYRDVTLNNKNEYIISNLDYRTTYYMNIIARNSKSGEIIAFNPIIVESGGYLPWPLWKSLLYYTILAFVCAGIVYLIKQIYIKFMNNEYTPVHNNDFTARNGYERADGYQRPDMNIEMPSVSKKEGYADDKNKYANLSEDENKL